MAAPPEEIDDADADAGELALRFSVDARHAGTRLDKALAELMPDVSRSRLQQWVADAAVRVNGAAVRQRHELVLGDLIEIEPQPAPDAKAYAPEPMALAIVHEDSDILVVDKPPGLVVHPAAGHWSGTLAQRAARALAAELRRSARGHRASPGCRHVGPDGRGQDARGAGAPGSPVAGTVGDARVLGRRAGRADAQPARSRRRSARDARNPLRFRVSHATSAKPARTRFAVVATAQDGTVRLSWLACRLDTGRTHQIRVHMEHIGHPLVGDPVYRRGLPGREGDPRLMARLRPAGAAREPTRVDPPGDRPGDDVVPRAARRSRGPDDPTRIRAAR